MRGARTRAQLVLCPCCSSWILFFSSLSKLSSQSLVDQRITSYPQFLVQRRRGCVFATPASPFFLSQPSSNPQNWNSQVGPQCPAAFSTLRSFPFRHRRTDVNTLSLISFLPKRIPHLVLLGDVHSSETSFRSTEQVITLSLFL